MLNTIISDNFTRNNGTVGNGWIGNNWLISSNKLTTNAALTDVLTRNDKYLDLELEATITNTNGVNVLISRYNIATGDCYYAGTVKTSANTYNVIIGRYFNNLTSVATLVTDTLTTNASTLKLRFKTVNSNSTNLTLTILDNNTVLKTVTTNDSTAVLQQSNNYGIRFGAVNANEVASISNLTISNITFNSIKPNNSKLVFSPYNWLIDETKAISNCNGSYLKFKFTGTSIEFKFDISNYSTQFPKFKYVLDNKTTSTITVNTNNLVINNLTDSEHEFFGYIDYLETTIDRWNTPISSLILKEIVLDDNRELLTVTKYATNTLLLGDSITEDTVSFSNSYSYYLLTSLPTELGVIAFSGLGFAIAPSGNNVPTANTVIDNYYNNKTRLVGNKLNPIPNTVIVNLGTNDGFNNVNTNTIKIAIESLITKLISYGNKDTKVIFLIPFGGYCKTEITQLANKYKLETIDLNEYVGLDNTGNSFKSTDGVHPNTTHSAYLGSKVTSKLLNVINRNKLLEILKSERINLRFDDNIPTKLVNRYLNTI
jgi:lysophospholipase L1-like esterase